MQKSLASGIETQDYFFDFPKNNSSAEVMSGALVQRAHVAIERRGDDDVVEMERREWQAWQ